MSETHDLDRLKIDRAGGRRRNFAWVFWVLGLVLAGALLVFVLFRPMIEKAMAPEVRAGAAVREAATSGHVLTTASGYVVARTRAAISSRLSGRLEKLLVDVGDRVEAGQLLGQLGHADLEAAVDEAGARVRARAADIAVLEARLGSARTSVASAKRRLSQVRAEVEVADAQLAEAERLLTVEQRLVNEGISDPDSLARRTAERDIAARRSRVARAAVEAAEGTVEQADAEVPILESQIAAARIAVDEARAALAHREALRADADIRAPFAGVVLEKEAEVGEMVAPVNSAGSTTRGAIVTLADFASLEIEVDLVERDVTHVAEGMPCRIVLDSRREAPYLGHVRQVVPTADRSRGTVQVKIAFAALDEYVKPDMSARVEFLDEGGEAVATADDRVLVPAAAVVGSAVWLIEGDAVRNQPIATSGQDEDRLVVTEGLLGGERVVLDPPPVGLGDGTVVRTVEAE